MVRVLRDAEATVTNTRSGVGMPRELWWTQYCCLQTFPNRSSNSDVYLGHSTKMSLWLGFREPEVPQSLGYWGWKMGSFQGTSKAASAPPNDGHPWKLETHLQYWSPIRVRIRVRFQRVTEPTAPGTLALEKACQQDYNRVPIWLPQHYSNLGHPRWQETQVQHQNAILFCIRFRDPESLQSWGTWAGKGKPRWSWEDTNNALTFFQSGTDLQHHPSISVRAQSATETTPLGTVGLE